MDKAAKRGRLRDPAMFFEYGTPSYNVAHLAQRLEMAPSNLRAYLLGLERDGLVIREWRQEVETWNAIPGGHRPRRVLCFRSAATMEYDRAAGDAWKAGAAARSAGAFEQMFCKPRPRQELPMVEVIR